MASRPATASSPPAPPAFATAIPSCLRVAQADEAGEGVAQRVPRLRKDQWVRAVRRALEVLEGPPSGPHGPDSEDEAATRVHPVPHPQPRLPARKAPRAPQARKGAVEVSVRVAE